LDGYFATQVMMEFFGKKYYQVIDDASNPLGLLWQDTTVEKRKTGRLQFFKKDDPASHDDIVAQSNMYIVKNKPVKTYYWFKGCSA